MHIAYGERHMVKTCATMRQLEQKQVVMACARRAAKK
jgi:hypothetical protein